LRVSNDAFLYALLSLSPWSPDLILIRLFSGNLSWNTNDDLLHQVRLFFCVCLGLDCLSRFFRFFDFFNFIRLSLRTARSPTFVFSVLLFGLYSPESVHRHEGPRDWSIARFRFCGPSLYSRLALGLTTQTYQDEAAANAAISAMNEQELDGRRVRVNLANAKPQGGGGYGGGGYQSGCKCNRNVEMR
jgi:hypothetical protein